MWSLIHKYQTYIVGATVLELKFLEMPVDLPQSGTLALPPRVATDRTVVIKLLLKKSHKKYTTRLPGNMLISLCRLLLCIDGAGKLYPPPLSIHH